MFQKVELLNKNEHLNLKVSQPKDFDFSKGIRHIPLGLSEIRKIATILPVVISSGEEMQFSAVISLKNDENYFTTNKSIIHIPALLKYYPFLMVNAKNGENDQLYRAVAMDMDSGYIGDDKEIPLFENNELTPTAQQIINNLQIYDKDRFAMISLVKELQKYNLLDKRDVELNINGNKQKILGDFFVVNRERLMQLEDKILLSWAKSGILLLLELHIASIENIANIL